MINQLIVIFMIIVFCIGMGIVIKDVVQHAAKNRLTRR